MNEVPAILKSTLGEVEINNNLQIQLGEEGALSEMGGRRKQFRPNPKQSPWAAKPADAPALTPLNSGFAPDHAEYNLGYDRSIPSHFSDGSDDQLMNSLLTNYAIEFKNADGNPSGKFYMDKKGTTAAATEVVKTHFGYKGDKLKNYVDEKMGKLWPHYDVLSQGYIDADRTAPLLRQVLGEVESTIGLQ